LHGVYDGLCVLGQCCAIDWTAKIFGAASSFDLSRALDVPRQWSDLEVPSSERLQKLQRYLDAWRVPPDSYILKEEETSDQAERELGSDMYRLILNSNVVDVFDCS
jgi:hypothetical protein